MLTEAVTVKYTAAVSYRLPQLGSSHCNTSPAVSILACCQAILKVPNRRICFSCPTVGLDRMLCTATAVLLRAE